MGLQQFFELNFTLVYLMYGLVFVLLGMAIALRSSHRSRLELASGLGWLAGFGVMHGFYEWGVIFIPVQETYLNPAGVKFLESIHVVMLALSFGFLFQFGVEMLRSFWPGLVAVPLAVMVVWMMLFFMPGFVVTRDVTHWHQNAIIWARYMIGFPAGLMAALGLKVQAKKTLENLNLNGIYKTLKVGGGALVAYAILSGLVVPQGNFFPASWLSETNFNNWLGLPVPILRSFTGLVLAIAIIRALEVFDLEIDQMIEQIEMERNLAFERERIGRELHDSTIQTIYTAGLLVQSARQKLPENDKSAQRLDRAMDVLNEVIAGLRAYIDVLRPTQDYQTLAEVIRSCENDSRWSSLINIETTIDLPGDIITNAPQIQHIKAILGEAISNAVRHATARQVRIDASHENNHVAIVIQDDGQGFQEMQNRKGYGLRNMRDRARLLGGSLSIESRPGVGTTVSLIAPLEVME